MNHVPMKHRRTTLERAEKFISEHHFKDVNLRGRLYPKTSPVTSIKTWAAPEGVYTPFEEAVKQEFTEAKVGQKFGPTWATHWFRVDVAVPADWCGSEVRLRWNSGSEALVWINAQPIQALCSEYERLDFALAECLTEKKLEFSVYIEMACNGMFGAGDGGIIEPPEIKRQFTLSSCEVAVFDKKVYKLVRDVELLYDLAKAQQFEWVKQQYPGLYKQIQAFVKKGKFIPVGGTWVEMDGLVPSGEAFIRQFLYGQRYFQKEFGITCKEFWLPDTFGYSAQLPQIMQQCGVTRFLTQKMSWNLVNKFPHHTFWWEGIDGSKVLSHFPPGDSYEMKGTVEEVLRTAKNFRDKGRSDKTAFLYGFGDGGNGPSEDMIERLQRMEDVDGLPRVKMSTPDELFSRIEAEDGQKLCRWAGELYLELHNGTYTTHARVKKMNRKCELLLQSVEFVSAVAMATTRQKGSKVTDVYHQEELDRLWKLLLLNQFHDVLPGSSIAMVYEDAHRYYNDIFKSGTKMFGDAAVVVSEGGEKKEKAGPSDHMIWNTQSWDRSEVITIAAPEAADSSPAGKKRKVSDETSQQVNDGSTLYYVKVPSYGYSYLHPQQPETSAQIGPATGGFSMRNDQLEAKLDKSGRVTELYVKGSKRNMVSGDNPANQFLLYDDIPLFWDAWDVMDYHLETRKPVETVVEEAKITESGPLRVALKFSLKISEQSSIEQTISLDVGSPYLKFTTQVVWHENRKFLKVEFPTSMHTREATYDIQMGHLRRPNHYNTSWDAARFEVCGHKWTDLSEFGCGVAVLNDCKYGHSAVDNIIRMSLLRSPKAPDKTADMETHTFIYALMPHIGSLQEAGVIQQAYGLNSPLYVQDMVSPVRPDTAGSASYFKVASPQVVLETVKKSEDDDGALVLRLYESFGGKCSTHLSTTLPFSKAQLCTGLEEVDDSLYPGADLKVVGENQVHFTIQPFQIISLKLTLQ